MTQRFLASFEQKEYDLAHFHYSSMASKQFAKGQRIAEGYLKAHHN